MTTQADHGMEPHLTAQEVSDRELLARLKVLEAKCEDEGMYVRANTAFLAFQRLKQLLGSLHHERL